MLNWPKSPESCKPDPRQVSIDLRRRAIGWELADLVRDLLIRDTILDRDLSLWIYVRTYLSIYYYYYE